jgi:hypothetical protein
MPEASSLGMEDGRVSERDVGTVDMVKAVVGSRLTVV